MALSLDAIWVVDWLSNNKKHLSKAIIRRNDHCEYHV